MERKLQHHIDQLRHNLQEEYRIEVMHVAIAATCVQNVVLVILRRQVKLLGVAADQDAIVAVDHTNDANMIQILERILKDIAERIRLGAVDRALGFVLGIAEGLLVVSAALFVLTIQPLFDPTALLEGSFFARLLLPLVGEAGRNAAAAVKGA